MSIVVSDLSERLDTLTKLVLAEPVARIGHSRVTVRPLTLRGKAFFQLEYQQGQKVAHRNVARGALLETFEQELDGLFRSVTLCTETETRQYVRKTNGAYKCTAKSGAACDVATDYALHYAISRGVEHIFSVPCCQHEVNKTIQKGGDFDILLSHGLFQERFSALLTDAIRAAVLEDEGYDVDVIEFIDFAHSPKNLMLRCHRTGHRGTKKLTESRRLRDQYGFEQTLLSLVENERQ